MKVIEKKHIYYKFTSSKSLANWRIEKIAWSKGQQFWPIFLAYLGRCCILVYIYTQQQRNLSWSLTFLKRFLRFSAILSVTRSHDLYIAFRIHFSPEPVTTNFAPSLKISYNDGDICGLKCIPLSAIFAIPRPSISILSCRQYTQSKLVVRNFASFLEK